MAVIDFDHALANTIDIQYENAIFGVTISENGVNIQSFPNTLNVQMSSVIIDGKLNPICNIQPILHLVTGTVLVSASWKGTYDLSVPKYVGTVTTTSTYFFEDIWMNFSTGTPFPYLPTDTPSGTFFPNMYSGLFFRDYTFKVPYSGYYNFKLDGNYFTSMECIVPSTLNFIAILSITLSGYTNTGTASFWNVQWNKIDSYSGSDCFSQIEFPQVNSNLLLVSGVLYKVQFNSQVIITSFSNPDGYSNFGFLYTGHPGILIQPFVLTGVSP
jgi:hypothetical protein